MPGKQQTPPFWSLVILSWQQTRNCSAAKENGGYNEKQIMIRSMPVLIAKIADDSDFLTLKNMVDHHDEWALEYDKNQVKVWTKSVADINFNMVKVWSNFLTVDSMDLYNTLQDPDYRKEWDSHMIIGTDIGHLNCNNDVSYYAMSCPPPLRNRDFVLQRSWLDTGNEHYIINHSVCHKDYPPRRGYIRAISYFTGYFIRQIPSKDIGCEVAYVTSSDPQGILPSWLVNKCTQIFAPRYIKQLEKAALGYSRWKNNHNPHYKPWIFPEQISSPKIRIEDCVPSATELEMCPQFKILIQNSNKMHEESNARMIPRSSRPSISAMISKRISDENPDPYSDTENDIKGKVMEGVPNIRSRTSKVLSWLDFTKSCRKRQCES